MYSTIVNLIFGYSMFFDIDPYLVMAVVEKESKFNPYVVGAYGEIGLMQLRPEFFSDDFTTFSVCKKEERKYARQMGPVQWNQELNLVPQELRQKRCGDDLFDIEKNIKVGIEYLAKLKKSCARHGKVGFVMCYNAGPTKAKRMVASKNTYVKAVNKNYLRLKNEQVFAHLISMNDL